MLGFLHSPKTILRLIGSMSDTEETLGEGIVALEEQCADPILHSTTRIGECDLVVFMGGNAESVQWYQRE